jgi:hypothetical protein
MKMLQIKKLFSLTFRRSRVVICAGDFFQMVGTAPGLSRRDTPLRWNKRSKQSVEKCSEHIIKRFSRELG